MTIEEVRKYNRDKMNRSRAAKRAARGYRMRKEMSLLEVLLSNCMPEPTTGCWLWLGCTNPKGYGDVRHGKVRGYAHRLMYEQLVGPIPEGLCLDHVRARGCSTTSCVNPDHLEIVTREENSRRAGVFAELNANFVKPPNLHACVRGHVYDDYNKRVRPNGTYFCRLCHRERERKRWRTARAREHQQ
jgi:hypothetical protein